MTFDNSTGLQFSTGDSVDPTPLLDVYYVRDIANGVPLTYSFAYEFTEDEATTLNLPDLTTTKSLTCYMSPSILVASSIPSDFDLNSEPGIPSDTSKIVPSITSDAMKLVGKKTVLAFVALLGLIALY